MKAFCVKKPIDIDNGWETYIDLLNQWDKSRSGYNFDFVGDGEQYYGIDTEGMRYASTSITDFNNNVIKLSDAIEKLRTHFYQKDGN